jgi:methylthioribose-1-phosphate isomerase
MKVDGKPYRTIWLNEDGSRVDIIDQTKFPHRFEIVTLATMEDAARAIKDMLVRGAPLIGATAAYGMALAVRADPSDASMQRPEVLRYQARRSISDGRSTRCCAC